MLRIGAVRFPGSYVCETASVPVPDTNDRKERRPYGLK